MGNLADITLLTQALYWRCFISRGFLTPATLGGPLCSLEYRAQRPLGKERDPRAYCKVTTTECYQPQTLGS